MLSDRYIADRFLPDKAIDLVDEAAAKLRIDATSRPQLLDQVSRRLLQVQMEEISLKQDALSDPRAASRLEGLCKVYGVGIVCSGSTYEALARSQGFLCRRLDTVKVKGRDEATDVYELVGRDETSAPPFQETADRLVTKLTSLTTELQQLREETIPELSHEVASLRQATRAWRRGRCL